MADYEDVLYDVDGPVAIVTINRPSRLNAFRARTIEELIQAFKRAWADDDAHAIVLTGAGDRAFCVGGDVKQRNETGDYGPTSNGLFEATYFHRLIRDVPKPVIAAVNGLAIGGGHVLHVLCDLTIAAEHARFGQAGPRVGSFDGGFGSAYLARVVGEKRAREIWFLLDQYSAADAERWGLVNRVVPADQLLPTAIEWGRTIARYSPTALLPQALFQRRHRPPGRPLAAIRGWAQRLPSNRRGQRGRCRLRGKARAGFRQISQVALS